MEVYILKLMCGTLGTILCPPSTKDKRCKHLFVKIIIQTFKIIKYFNSKLYFEVRHPRCVSNKSNVMCTQYVVKHNVILDGMLIY